MPSLWIIDGYNFIRTSERFAELEAHKPEAGVKAALAWLGDFATATGEEVRVVLDAYSGVHRDPIKKNNFGIEVIHSRGGYTADEEIIEMAQQRGQGAVIISSDRAVQTGAIKAGCSILSSQEFERELTKVFRHAEAMVEEGHHPRRQNFKGRAFRPPKEKKKAFQILRKYQ